MSEVAPRRLTVERPENRSLDEVIAGSTSKCRLCKGNHTLQKCPEFRRLKPYKRLGVVRRYKYCINCLAQSHFLRNCRSRERCMECLGHHHTMLHLRPYVGKNARQPYNINHKETKAIKGNNKSATRSQAPECSCRSRSHQKDKIVDATPNNAGATIVFNVVSKWTLISM